VVYQEVILMPLDRCIAQMQALEEALKKRAKKLLDYDDARSRAMKLESKTTADGRKVEKAKAEETQARIVFESLQNEIVQALPKINQSREMVLAQARECFRDINGRLAADVAKFLTPETQAPRKCNLDGQVTAAMDTIRALQIVSPSAK
jgi:hypothetical protein